MKIDYSTVPVSYMADGLRRYIEQGIEPGDFMKALLSNNLKEAVACADDANTRALVQWVEWCYHNLPANAWGSADDYKYWVWRYKAERDE